jgi:acetolactate synthase regulatory subunit
MQNNRTAHLHLECTWSSILLERLLQTVRYRGFNISNLAFNQVSDERAEVQFMVKGQAKLTTLQKSLEALIEVQQCYLTEDKAKLESLLELGQYTCPSGIYQAQTITT